MTTAAGYNTGLGHPMFPPGVRSGGTTPFNRRPGLLVEWKDRAKRKKSPTSSEGLRNTLKAPRNRVAHPSSTGSDCWGALSSRCPATGRPARARTARRRRGGEASGQSRRPVGRRSDGVPDQPRRRGDARAGAQRQLVSFCLIPAINTPPSSPPGSRLGRGRRSRTPRTGTCTPTATCPR
jgi:hypothetical protein